MRGIGEPRRRQPFVLDIGGNTSADGGWVGWPQQSLPSPVFNQSPPLTSEGQERNPYAGAIRENWKSFPETASINSYWSSLAMVMSWAPESDGEELLQPLHCHYGQAPTCI